jgi:hypothetical protein
MFIHHAIIYVRGEILPHSSDETSINAMVDLLLLLNSQVLTQKKQLKPNLVQLNVKRL